MGDDSGSGSPFDGERDDVVDCHRDWLLLRSKRPGRLLREGEGELAPRRPSEGDDQGTALAESRWELLEPMRYDDQSQSPPAYRCGVRFELRRRA
ncbi:hypothetical protein [Tepidiforma sp.]|uniref:hypothetical protein n=1 Tax=Tepidiforma sp. TaxID=2682230 RepID=UPI002ADE829C|nr:hypothetical protein [Tepidiforma sp.]